MSAVTDELSLKGTDLPADEEIFDAIIVGAGMAGSACASRLAAGGLRCLIVEAGGATAKEPGPARRSLPAKVLGKLGFARPEPLPGRWPGMIERTLRRRVIEHPAVLGTGRGGGSIVYGAALARFRRRDFEVDYRPDQDPDGPSGAMLLPNAWPVAYEDMTLWYDVAEEAMGVRGTLDPLDPDHSALREPAAPANAAPRDVAIAAQMQAKGLHPYRLPVGIAYLPGCVECLGTACPRPCKTNAWKRFAGGDAMSLPIETRTGLTVGRIDRNGDGLFVIDAGEGRLLHARRVVLAAGALNSPRILLRSAELWKDGRHPAMLGRGLMFHISDIFTLRVRGSVSDAGNRKTVALRDFYAPGGVPLGEVQSMGIRPAPAMIVGFVRSEMERLGLGRLSVLAEGLRVPMYLMRTLFARLTVFATILEDLPYAGNRVMAMGRHPSNLRIEYTIGPELTYRARELRRRVRRSFRGMMPLFINSLAVPNYGHPMGTCRMGDDPATSVTDARGEVWGQPGLFVCDASTFPSSGGTNPGLTVLANALRIGEGIANGASARDGVSA